MIESTERFAKQHVVAIVAFIGGLLSAVLTARSIHWGYYSFTNSPLLDVFPRSGALLYVLAFIACLYVFVRAIWRTPSSGGETGGSPIGAARYPWRRIDMGLWIVLAAVLFFYCEYLASYQFPNRVIELTFIAYSAVIITLGEIVARMRDKQISESLYWVKFFESYRLSEPIAWIMLFLLSSLLVATFIVIRLRGTGIGVTGPLFFCVAALCALTYLVQFILTLSARYREANTEAIRAEQFKVELITNVSHDIRTPLTSIINYVDLLGDFESESPRFEEYVGVLERKSARLNALIGDLMEASKASTGALPVNKAKVDLAEIVGQVAGEFDDLYVANEMTLVLRNSDTPLFVHTDSSHLWRVLENLFGNAGKHALPGTRVFAEIEQEDGTAILSLKNVSKEPLEIVGEQLTEQFIRGDKARQTDGSGLGLYIAKSLVELMEGGFAIDTSGDLFIARISLPLVACEE